MGGCCLSKKKRRKLRRKTIFIKEQSNNSDAEECSYPDRDQLYSEIGPSPISVARHQSKPLGKINNKPEIPTKATTKQKKNSKLKCRKQTLNQRTKNGFKSKILLT